MLLSLRFLILYPPLKLIESGEIHETCPKRAEGEGGWNELLTPEGVGDIDRSRSVTGPAQPATSGWLCTFFIVFIYDHNTDLSSPCCVTLWASVISTLIAYIQQVGFEQQMPLVLQDTEFR
jgi:hypothetical protein